MRVTLAGTLLRITWQPHAFDDATNAEIERRLGTIDTALRSDQKSRGILETWYIHLEQLETVMEQFPKAEFHPDVIAAYPPGKLAQPVQGTLIDTGDRVFEWMQKGKRRKAKA